MDYADKLVLINKQSKKVTTQNERVDPVFELEFPLVTREGRVYGVKEEYAQQLADLLVKESSPLTWASIDVLQYKGTTANHEKRCLLVYAAGIESDSVVSDFLESCKQEICNNIVDMLKVVNVDPTIKEVQKSQVMLGKPVITKFH